MFMAVVAVIGLVTAAAGTGYSIYQGNKSMDAAERTKDRQIKDMKKAEARNVEQAKMRRRSIAQQAGRSWLDTKKAERAMKRTQQSAAMANTQGNSTVNLGTRPLGKPVIV